MFPHPRRIVTGHDSKGRAIVLKDSQIPCVPTPIGANFAVLWETHEFPANNNGFVDPAENKTSSLANDKGLVLRVVDFPARTDTVSSSYSRSRYSNLIYWSWYLDGSSDSLFRFWHCVCRRDWLVTGSDDIREKYVLTNIKALSMMGSWSTWKQATPVFSVAQCINGLTPAIPRRESIFSSRVISTLQVCFDIAYWIIAANPITIDGQVLGNHGFHDEDVAT